MSISVDDLVATLSSNHIGQEAMDIADLQAQLTETLLYQSTQQQTQASGMAPCNTPTARTPSTINWPHSADGNRRRSGSVASIQSVRSNIGWQGNIPEEDMEEDEEYAVEQQLVGSPTTTTSPFQRRKLSLSTTDPFYSVSQQSRNFNTHTFEPTSPTQTVFTTTDPFYAAAFKASQMQSHTNTTSYFAQSALPSQPSPFFTHVPHQQSHPQSQPIPLSIDTGRRYVTASSFD